MRALNVVWAAIAVFILSAMVSQNTFAESRTLTTRIMVTVKAPALQAPKGLEDIYSAALTQVDTQRFVKAEDALSTATGLPRYTMTERL